MPDDPMEGRVKTLRRDKGFGFIAADGGDYFFHRSACLDFDHLSEGTLVRFTPNRTSSKGPRADHVEVLA